MGLFDRIFGKQDEELSQPNVTFGRFSDSYKKDVQYDAWDRALEKFEDKNYIASYEEFFQYLKDEEENNVKTWKEKETLHFEFFQGSKKIVGFANVRQVKAMAKIATCETLHISYLRRLLENNFSLRYGRYALDEENNITINFDTYVLDGSPYKLYYAFKEIAISADKQDDILLDEFESLKSIDTGHLAALPDQEKEAKYEFIKNSIGPVLSEIDNGKLNAEQYPGGIAYLLLDLIYKMDYLCRPEGYLMETLERCHRLYFAQDGASIGQKNLALQKEFKKLLDRSKEEYFKEMYKTVSTFGITNPVNHDKVVGFIDGEMAHLTWYIENKYETVALAIAGYVVGFCLFNHAIPQPDKDYFNLYYQIMEPTYFKALGFSENYLDANKKLNPKAIKKAVKRIADKNHAIYIELNPDINSLKFGSLPEFAQSYLLMVRELDLTKTN